MRAQLVAARSRWRRACGDRRAVEHAHDDLLAVRDGKGGHAQVHHRAAHRHARAAVLRTHAVGDVEPREDLDARHERRRRGARRGCAPGAARRPRDGARRSPAPPARGGCRSRRSGSPSASSWSTSRIADAPGSAPGSTAASSPKARCCTSTGGAALSAGGAPGRRIPALDLARELRVRREQPAHPVTGREAHGVLGIEIERIARGHQQHAAIEREREHPVVAGPPLRQQRHGAGIHAAEVGGTGFGERAGGHAARIGSLWRTDRHPRPRARHRSIAPARR